MKKIIYAFVALLAVMLSSCSNDDIEITSVGSKHDVAYTVNTRALYSAVSLDESIQDIFFRDNSGTVGLYVFVYNDRGEKVAEDAFTSPNFNSVTKSFELEEGDYTFVTIEGLILSDNDSPKWSIMETDALSTIRLDFSSTARYFWYDIAGIATNKVTVTDNTNSLAISPSPLGSILYSYFLGFDSYPDVESYGFGSTDRVEQYLIDPAISDSDRYLIDLSSEGYFTLRYSRSNDGSDYYRCTLWIPDDQIKYHFAIHLKSQDNGMWYLYPSDGKKVKLTNGGCYYCGAYCFASGNLYWHWDDTFKGFQDWYEKVKKENETQILPTLNLNWGTTVSAVQQTMSGYTMTMGSTGVAEYDTTTKTYEIDYQGKGYETLISYYFNQSTGDLYNADVYYRTSSLSTEDLAKYLNENYVFEGSQENVTLYSTSDGKTIIFLTSLENINVVSFYTSTYFSSPAMYCPPAKEKASSINEFPSSRSTGFMSIDNGLMKLDNTLSLQPFSPDMKPYETSKINLDNLIMK